MKFFKSKINSFRCVVIAITICFTISSLILLGGGVFALDTGLETTAGEAGLLANTSLITILAKIVQTILGFLGIMFVILIMYGGFMRMTAQGEAEKIKKSTGIIISAVIGVAIILAAYTITAFVLGQIKTNIGDGVYDYEADIKTGGLGTLCINSGGKCGTSCSNNLGQKDCPTGETCCRQDYTMDSYGACLFSGTCTDTLPKDCNYNFVSDKLCHQIGY